jgi:hypothetical protein
MLSIKARLAPFEGSIKAPLRLYCTRASGVSTAVDLSIQARSVLRLYQGSFKGCIKKLLRLRSNKRVQGGGGGGGAPGVVVKLLVYAALSY